MNNYSSKCLLYLVKLGKFIFSREVGIELVKILVTTFIGFITYKIYQLHRNKKDNIKLYIHMTKLENEILDNKKTLRNILDEDKEYSEIELIFYEENNGELYKLFKLIDSLKSYTYEDIIYDGQNPIDMQYVYTEYPYSEIKELTGMINHIGAFGEDYYGQRHDFENQIAERESSSIFDLLIEIEEMVRNLKTNDEKMKEALEYLTLKLKDYNSLNRMLRLKNIDLFCTQLLDVENPIQIYIKSFARYKYLSLKFNKYENEKLEFNIWKLEEMDLLGVFNIKIYMELIKFYSTNQNLLIEQDNINQIKYKYDELQEIYKSYIIKEKNEIKKIIDKTNKIFNKI